MRDLVAVDQELAPPTVGPVCSIWILAEAIDSPIPHFRHLLVGWVPCHGALQAYCSQCYPVICLEVFSCLPVSEGPSLRRVRRPER